MSGGLLEKAKQASGDDDLDVDAAADAVIDTEWTEAPASGGSPLMLYIAGGSLLICMGLLYFMYLLPAYSGVLIFLMLIGSAYTASLHVRSSHNNGSALNGMQWASIAVVSYTHLTLPTILLV